MEKIWCSLLLIFLIYDCLSHPEQDLHKHVSLTHFSLDSPPALYSQYCQYSQYCTLFPVTLAISHSNFATVHHSQLPPPHSQVIYGISPTGRDLLDKSPNWILHQIPLLTFSNVSTLFYKNKNILRDWGSTALNQLALLTQLWSRRAISIHILFLYKI